MLEDMVQNCGGRQHAKKTVLSDEVTELAIRLKNPFFL